MPGLATKAGHGLAKVLGIKLEDQPSVYNDEVTRGESIMSGHTSTSFVENVPTSSEWLNDQAPSTHEVLAYTRSLFPFLSWIAHYNLQWFAGDLVAGITIGAVVVPQGMAYAILANLEPQFGLYSSFIGVLIYWVFGTSKDISIGPVAVLSTVVGNVVQDISNDNPDMPAYVIASALSIIAGCIVLAIGLLRCGWIVDLISIASLSAFMTGSAITICVGQLPSLMGISGFSSRDSPYKVFINTLKHLPDTQVDAVMGLSALAMLYTIRYAMMTSADRFPKYKRILFFTNTMRTVFVILLYTMISWLLNRSRRDDPMIEILGTIPKGFRHIGVPKMTSGLVSKFGSYLPATVIVLLVEHIAISKSFGRVNNYTIDPSQEMVAIGMTNIIGPFFGAYPSTGSFSRTAIQSKAGVRTPAAGIVTGVVVLIATYLLTAVFFYIPKATLAAVIIHAVGDLVTPPNTVYHFWRVSPIEAFIFFIGVFVSIFTQIEDGLYTTVFLSAAVLIYRILKARGRFLGKVRVHSVIGDHVIGDNHRQLMGTYGTFDNVDSSARNVFLPLDHGDGSNPEVEVDHPYPGIFIYRFSEGFSYPNANFALEYLSDFVQAHTRRTSAENFERPGDRPWNNPGPRKSSKRPAASDIDYNLPFLKAIIMDFSSVNNVDITSIQRLIDIRNQLDMYTAPNAVDWHFACINNRWTKRALVSGGFGVPAGRGDGSAQRRWQSIFSVAEIGGKHSAAAAAAAEQDAANEAHRGERGTKDEEMALGGYSVVDVDIGMSSGEEAEKLRRKGAAIHGLDMPLFHVDLTSALQSAIANVEGQHE